MTRVVPLLLILVFYCNVARSQITGPAIRANFGVDADLRSNYFNGFVQPGNDDWFVLPGSLGAGQFVIDTTGAAGIVARYAASVPSRRSSLMRMMRFPVFSTINNRLLLDAAFVRDFHGDDSTVYASGASKNGDSPGDWNTPVSQGIPDKNDILDMMVHIRRAGPNFSDSLWMFGGMSLDNTTGDRYFDFEMYQTDLAYDRPNLRFVGYGPDAGHTSWEFDGSGNITKAGDIIFSAEYQSSSLTFIEARIWINRASLAINPVAFAWSGEFDGAGSGATYGYASIQPRIGGTYYTGLQCANNTWGGPFSIVLQNDALATNYISRQYVEFSVNLTKLGLDPVTSITGNPCGMPFRRLLVKTRASASFTAQLKDFVAPIAMFDLPEANLATATPSICNSGSLAEIHVTNPIATSIYTWTTVNGSIVSAPSGPSILVDTPGTYIVTQYLTTGCPVHSRDTIEILPSNGCLVLPAQIQEFRGAYRDNGAHLSWKVTANGSVQSFVVQRSDDGINFTTIGEVEGADDHGSASYTFNDDLTGFNGARVFYRIIVLDEVNGPKFSNTISLSLSKSIKDKLQIFPNPVKDIVQVQLQSPANNKIKIDIFDPGGRLIATHSLSVQRGLNAITIDDLAGKPRGAYLIVVNTGEEVLYQRVLVMK